VGVIGCGVMGSGIAQAIASAGFEVTVLEAEQRFLDRGWANMKQSLGRLEKKDKLKDPIETILGRLKGTTSPPDLADCDLIIEAIVENVAEKRKVLAALDTIVKKDAIFSSNTSSLSITELMTATKRHDRFIGFHFSNPAPVLPMVEVVRTIVTAPEVYETAVEFAKALGKVPVRTSDKPAFVLNRLLIPYMLDAIRAYEEGVGSIADIDTTMKHGGGHPMGPFTLMDLVGLDTMYNISIVMFDEFKERRFASPPLLKRMVMAGWLGRKTGRGFYDYSTPGEAEPMDAALKGFEPIAKAAAR
jgi:3-hydroxybutyryl-CoA dehydrogenase